MAYSGLTETEISVNKPNTNTLWGKVKNNEAWLFSKVNEFTSPFDIVNGSFEILNDDASTPADWDLNSLGGTIAINTTDQAYGTNCLEMTQPGTAGAGGAGGGYQATSGYVELRDRNAYRIPVSVLFKYYTADYKCDYVETGGDDVSAWTAWETFSNAGATFTGIFVGVDAVLGHFYYIADVGTPTNDELITGDTSGETAHIAAADENYPIAYDKYLTDTNCNFRIDARAKEYADEANWATGATSETNGSTWTTTGVAFDFKNQKFYYNKVSGDPATLQNFELDSNPSNADYEVGNTQAVGPANQTGVLPEVHVKVALRYYDSSQVYITDSETDIFDTRLGNIISTSWARLNMAGGDAPTTAKYFKLVLYGGYTDVDTIIPVKMYWDFAKTSDIISYCVGAGDEVLVDSDDGSDSTSQSYLSTYWYSIKSLTLVRGGTLRVKYTHNGLHSLAYLKCEVRKNGITIGDTESVTPGSNTITQDFDGFTAGDLVDIYVYDTSQNDDFSITNFRIYTDTEPTSLLD